MDLTEKELHVLRHALGLNRSTSSYRNYFVAGKRHHDMSELESLVSKGLMVSRSDLFDEVSGSLVFHVTEAGKLIALKQTPKDVR